MAENSTSSVAACQTNRIVSSTAKETRSKVVARQWIPFAFVNRKGKTGQNLLLASPPAI
jgi:hypothetical protein